MKASVLCAIYLFYFALKIFFYGVFWDFSPPAQLPTVERNPLLRLSFLDVGQGDAILISSANETLLLDGGIGYDVDFLIDQRFPITYCHINKLVLTHPHADHVEGLYRIVQRCKIDEVLSNPAPNAESSLFDSWEEILDGRISNGEKVIPAYDGYSFYLGEVFFKVLWPIEGQVNADLNDYSIVLFLDYKDFEALFLGDVNKESLEKTDFSVLKRYVDGSLDVLKVSHHGSRKGLYKKLFDMYKFDYAVISVGEDNSYDHPHEDALEFLVSQNLEILRTDVEGTVEIVYNSR